MCLLSPSVFLFFAHPMHAYLTVPREAPATMIKYRSDKFMKRFLPCQSLQGDVGRTPTLLLRLGRTASRDVLFHPQASRGCPSSAFVQVPRGPFEGVRSPGSEPSHLRCFIFVLAFQARLTWERTERICNESPPTGQHVKALYASFKPCLSMTGCP
jgi:hypothetical protein